MRVAVELSQLNSVASDRGLGRYARAVFATQPLLSDVTFVPFSVPLRAGRAGELRSIPRRLSSLRATRADLQHTLSPYLLGRAPSRAWVVSILDLIPLLVRCHQQTGVKARLVHQWAARADAFLTISEFSKVQLERCLRIAAEKIVVAPLPPSLDCSSDDDSTELGVGIREVPYALAVADCRWPDPRKRLEWLVDVGRGLVDAGGKLVVVGADSERRFRQFRGVQPLGSVSDAALRALMRDARIFVFASAYEGQGLPPLEAMSFGVPVVAMNNTSLPEVVRDGGILVEEETPDWALNACRGGEQGAARARFVEACVGLFADAQRRASLGANAIARAASFDQRRFALGIRSAYELAVNA